MNTELVIFDIAGTTVADSGNINDAFRQAFLASGIDISASEVDTVMGYRKSEAISLMVQKHAPELLLENDLVIQTIHELFNRNMVHFYKNNTDLNSLPYAEEVFNLFQESGIRVALNTGFTRDITNAILVNLGWYANPLINRVICSDEVPEGRPHPYMIREIMYQLGVADASKVVKVGDTQVDIQEGRSAGCGLVVAVTTGAYSKEQLIQYQPDFIIDTLQQLPALIL